VQDDKPSGHEGGGQANGLLHLTSHLHDVKQSIAWHDDAPAQSTEHSPNPQLIGPHAIALEQLMSQLAPSAQSMVPQALALLHRIVHANPSGHCTLPHGLLAVQSIRQVISESSHDVHGNGQSLMRSTQYPRSQVRVVSLQSLSLVHASSLECRSTEQLVVDSSPSPMIATTRTTAAGFITDLP
jgi:hypothetical protein